MRKILGIFSFLLLLTILVACGKKDPTTYTVTFESNGGSAVTAIANVEANSTITAPTNPTRSGYTFDGWYKDVALTDDWVFATDVVTANITLYAKWTVIPTFTVTFQSNGGTAVAAITNVANNSLITAPTNPTRANYTFAGWFKETGLTNQWNFGSDRVTANITLYAKWDAVGPTDQQKVDAVYDWLNLTNLNDLTNASPRIIMPVENMSYPGVAISWERSHPAVILANGVIVQPDAETGDVTVTLTATITAGAVTRTKTFTATVLALPDATEMPPIINETFKGYNDGNILEQVGPWMPVSSKTGNSIFTVVSTITGMTIPEDSKALKIEAFTELQVEAPITHTYDVLVIEVDLMQTASSNGSPVHIQSSSSSPVVGFGLNGTTLYYRVDNNSNMSLHAITVQTNQWYRFRMEIDLVNKTVQGFYYQDGQLVAIDEPITYTGTTNFQSLFIRSGSSTNTELRAPAYVTNIVVNRIESLPRPEEMVKLGDVTGIRATVNQAAGTPFTPDTPVVYNLYGSQGQLTLTEDYTVAVTNPVDIDVPGVYTVVYTITNANDPLDVKIINQEVTIYSEGEPNVIESVTSTPVNYFTHESSITITLQRAEGTLYYLLSNNATEEAVDIIANGQELPVSQTVIELISMIIAHDYIHVVVVLNGNSNVISHQFIDQNVNLITTREQFYQMASVENTGVNVLMNDLDFTGFNWVVTSASFKGMLYGQGYTISNLVINLPAAASNTYGGIFSRTNGAYIENLYLDNITVTTPARAGILTGRNENTLSTFKNIVIMNSSVTGGDSNGVGGLIGLASANTILENITIAYTSILADGVKNAGGVIGRVDGGTLTASDIYITNVTVTSNVGDGTDHGVGGFVGYVRDSATSIVNATRIVIENTTIDAPIAGAIIGYLRDPGTATITHVYFTVEILDAVRSGVVGRINTELSLLDNATLFGVIVGEVPHSSAQPLVNDLSAVTVDNAWWLAHLASIFNSDLWTVTNGKAVLDFYAIVMLEEFDVTLIYNVDDLDEVISIRDGLPFIHTAPAAPGYQFVGWFLDALMETPLPEGYVVTEDVTLYGKYETVPASTVTFNANMEGVTVDPQLVNYGEFATQPVVPQTMHEEVLKYVSGWTLNGEPFNFASTPITEPITLEAVWSVVNYTVIFGSGDGIVVPYGQLATPPTEDPVHPMFAEITFAGWTLSGVLFDFDTPITANITLAVSWNEPAVPLSITTVEQFYFMAQTTNAYDYVLNADLDFTGFGWTATSASFSGTLDGKNHTVSNITVTLPSTASNVYGGIFSRISGATIENLIIDNFFIETPARAGALVGRVENNESVIRNVMVINSTIIGGDSNGVGGLIGLVSRTTYIDNIVMMQTVVTASGQKNVGGVIGRIDHTSVVAKLVATNVFIENVTVNATAASGEDFGAGAFVGYIRDNVNAQLEASYIVVYNTTVNALVAGAAIGYLRAPGTATVQHSYFEVTFGTNNSSGLVGRINSPDPGLDQTTIFGTLTNVVVALRAQQLINQVALETINQAWWETNLPAIYYSQDWELLDGVAYLSYEYFMFADDVEVTLVIGLGEDDIILTLKDGMTFKGLAPEIEGYAFDAWYTDELLTMQLEPGYKVTEDITLYAKYTMLATYTVTFDSNEGSAVEAITDVADGSTILEPADPTRTGYNFLGWFKDELLTTAWDFDTDVVTEDITLYAKWELIVYTVSFESNEGSAVAAIEDVLPGSTITAPAAPTRMGYDFIGWFKDELLTTAWDFGTDTVTEDITLYAKWEVASENTYTVTFESNGGSAVSQITDVPEGTTVAAPADPTKEGYTFAGWFVDELFATEWDFDLDTVEEDMTLYAKWDEYVPLGTPITTPAEFMAAVSAGAATNYYLANDLDFTDVPWVQSGSGTRFVSILDGNFKTISNLNITGSGTGVYGGIFQRTGAGAVMKNLTITNSSISVTGRVGLLVGRVEVSGLVIENVNVINASVTGTDANGVGLLIGNASLGFTMSQVTITGSTVTSSAKNVALVAGRADDYATITDIYIKDSTVVSNVSSSTDQGVGALVGYTNHANANVNVNRVVLDDVSLSGRSAGYVVGYYKLGSVTVNNMFSHVTFTYGGSDGQHGVFGRRDVTNDTLSNMFEFTVGLQVAGTSVQLAAQYVLGNLSEADLEWWDTNLPAFALSPLWSYDEVSSFYKLG